MWIAKEATMELKRREVLVGIGSLGAGLFLSGCVSATGMLPIRAEPSSDKNKEAMGGDVTAVEDLMREHGILRRALFAYSEAAAKLRSNPSSIAPEALQRIAQLFRAFGEEYHERKLEEAYIFPAVKRVGGETAGLADILIVQHQRGRDITDYVLAMTSGTKLRVDNAEPLARAIESLVRMYRPHAAREDTIVFPAWKQTLTAKQLDEMNDKFEEIEHREFGADGFENAVRQIGDIEVKLGLADIAQFTAQPPPPR
jgi:hemerythrin-like domain-containing protein